MVLIFHPASRSLHFFLFFFNDTATTEIYTLSLHDALPISLASLSPQENRVLALIAEGCTNKEVEHAIRSEEHTSELQSPDHLVCRLLLEKKKRTRTRTACRSCKRCHRASTLLTYRLSATRI